jgi:hypothetical protein
LPVGAGCFFGKKIIATVLYNNVLNFIKYNQTIVDFKIAYCFK